MADTYPQIPGLNMPRILNVLNTEVLLVELFYQSQITSRPIIENQFIGVANLAIYHMLKTADFKPSSVPDPMPGASFLFPLIMFCFT